MGSGKFLRHPALQTKVVVAFWTLHISGYQVSEKWLNYRKGRTLSAEDIEYYQRVVVALNETIRIMGEIKRARWLANPTKRDTACLLASHMLQSTYCWQEFDPGGDAYVSSQRRIREGPGATDPEHPGAGRAAGDYHIS